MSNSEVSAVRKEYIFGRISKEEYLQKVKLAQENEEKEKLNKPKSSRNQSLLSRIVEPSPTYLFVSITHLIIYMITFAYTPRCDALFHKIFTPYGLFNTFKLTRKILMLFFVITRILIHRIFSNAFGFFFISSMIKNVVYESILLGVLITFVFNKLEI